eukprot:TRINITY_DN25998_c0_g1_i3.p2 TRINITY_DN25998_c0_g1~~TRINITY_DN25998_c0_g1_i3.p2  ORF type:complete len:316 (+),score=69.29 TRINITY_DN25998_c0_g1_i3:467-1414(+)
MKGVIMCSDEENYEKMTPVIRDLAYLALTVGNQPRGSNASKLFWVSQAKIRDDARNVTGNALLRKPIYHVDKLYAEHGYTIVGADPSMPSCRRIVNQPDAWWSSGCDPRWPPEEESDMPTDEICICLTSVKKLSSGWGLCAADSELFVRLTKILPAKADVFIIGNAFGYSSILLALLLAGHVDALDAEIEGTCNTAGSWLTRKIAKKAGLDLQLTSGFSPQDVPGAMRAQKYGLAFIDGDHTEKQMLLDFYAVEPYMADSAVIVLHDIASFDLDKAVAKLPEEWRRHRVFGRNYLNLVGTVLVYRGYQEGILEEL